MKLVQTWLSLVLFWFSSIAYASDSKLSLAYGAYSINATSSLNSTSISQPYFFSISYQKALSNSYALNLGYSLLLGDMYASDMGYGVNIGIDYYLFKTAKEDIFKDDVVTLKRSAIWNPFLGIGFYQRNFQSIKNSYAGFGFDGGIERYFSKKINVKAEFRFINLSGSSNSSATEMDLMLGIIYKL